MRQQFVDCKSRKTAWRRCPWAAFVTKCDGGFMAFESAVAYRQWTQQI